MKRSLSLATLVGSITVSFALVAALPAAAQKAPWPPIWVDDAAMKDCPQQPGAPAVILYREEITDVESHYHNRVQAAEGPHRRRPRAIEHRDPVHHGLHQDQRASRPASFRPKVRNASSTVRSSRKRPCVIASSRWPSRPSRSPTSRSDRSSITATRSSTASRVPSAKKESRRPHDRPRRGSKAGRRKEALSKQKRPRAVPVLSWQVQEDLFTKKAKFSYRNPQSIIAFLLGGGWRLSWASVGLKDGDAQGQLGPGGPGDV